VRTLEEALAGALDRPAVARLLGVRARDVRGLEEIGLLSPCPGLGTRGRHRFLSSEVLAIAARIPHPDAIRPARVARAVPFHAYARLKGRSAAELVADLLSGDAVPVGRIDGRPGFGGLAFTVDGEARVITMADRGRTQVVRGGITFGDAAVRLGITHPTVAALVREGFLTVIDADRTGTGLERVDAGSLEAFGAGYVTAKSLARMLRCHPNNASQKLRQMGIEPILDPGSPARLTAIVRRSEVEGRVTSAREPGSDREEFWARARDELARSCPAFLLPPGAPATEAVLWNSRRTAAVRVVLDERKLLLHMECDAGASRRRYLRAVERRLQIERSSGFDWIDYGGGIRLQARFAGLNLAQRSTWTSAIGWMAKRLAELQAAFGGR
jgi:hypothetical protein